MANIICFRCRFKIEECACQAIDDMAAKVEAENYDTMKPRAINIPIKTQTTTEFLEAIGVQSLSPVEEALNMMRDWFK